MSLDRWLRSPLLWRRILLSYLLRRIFSNRLLWHSLLSVLSPGLRRCHPCRLLLSLGQESLLRLFSQHLPSKLWKLRSRQQSKNRHVWSLHWSLFLWDWLWFWLLLFRHNDLILCRKHRVLFENGIKIHLGHCAKHVLHFIKLCLWLWWFDWFRFLFNNNLLFLLGLS